MIPRKSPLPSSLKASEIAEEQGKSLLGNEPRWFVVCRHHSLHILVEYGAETAPDFSVLLRHMRRKLQKLCLPMVYFVDLCSQLKVRKEFFWKQGFNFKSSGDCDRSVETLPVLKEEKQPQSSLSSTPPNQVQVEGSEVPTSKERQLRPKVKVQQSCLESFRYSYSFAFRAIFLVVLAGISGAFGIQGRGASVLANPTQSAPNPPSMAAPANVDWVPWLAALKRKVEQNWIPGQVDTYRRTEVVFTVSRGGELQSIRLAESSGSQQFDDAALTAIQQAAPFSPLLEGYEGNSVTIRFTFEAKVSRLSPAGGSGGSRQVSGSGGSRQVGGSGGSRQVSGSGGYRQEDGGPTP